MTVDAFREIIVVLWLLLPAYFANAAALLVGGGTPIDFGRKLNGAPVFGKSKTWRGFIGGTALGSGLGLLQQYAATNYIYMIVPPFGHTILEAGITIFMLSFGAMSGDLLGSFIKRRLGYGSGSEVIVLDQLPFLFISMLLLLIFVPFFFLTYFISYDAIPIIIAVIFTLIIHRVANIYGFLLGRKKVPW